MTRVCEHCGANLQATGSLSDDLNACPACSALLSSPAAPARPGGGPDSSTMPAEHGREMPSTTRLLENRRSERLKRGGTPPDAEEEDLHLAPGPPAFPFRHEANRGEPWFYRFLEMFAYMLIILFVAGIFLLFAVPLVMATDLFESAPANWHFLGHQLAALGLLLGALLVVVLFQTAVLLLLVDAGRNLRQINLRLSLGDEARDRDRCR
jgi:hypothetical protein